MKAGIGYHEFVSLAIKGGALRLSCNQACACSRLDVMWSESCTEVGESYRKHVSLAIEQGALRLSCNQQVPA